MSKAKIKIFLIFIILSFFFVNRTTSQEEIKALIYLEKDEISHMKIITPNDINEMIVEVFNKESELTHFFTFHSPFKENIEDNLKNVFYITNKMAKFDEFHQFIIYSNNHNREIFQTSKVKTLSLEEEKNIRADSLEEEKNIRTVFSEGVKKENEVETLKVMTYNIHHGKNIFGAYTLDQIASVIEESGADIIGLQEVDSGLYRSQFKDQIKYLAERLSMYYVYGDNIKFLGGKYGNGVLSRYPIEYHENLIMPSFKENRGILSTKININGESLYFLVTHMSLNDEERLKHAQMIDSYLNTIPGEMILVGDFNATSRSPEIEVFSKRLIDAGHATGNEHVPTFDVSFWNSRIDYIFVHPRLEIIHYEVIKSRASDHYPVIAEVIFP